MQTDTSSTQMVKRRPGKMFRLYSYIKPYWLSFTAGMLFLVLSSLAGLTIPYLLGQLVDHGAKDHLPEAINRVGLLLLAVLSGQAVLSFFRVTLFVNVTERTLSALRQDVYNHLIRLPMSFFMRRKIGELNSHISADISLLQETLATTLAEFIRNAITFAGAFALLLTTSLKLALFILLVFPLILGTGLLFGKYIRKFSGDAQGKIAEANNILEETLQGILSVKAFANEFFEMKRYRKKVMEGADIGIKNGKYKGVLTSMLLFLSFGAIVIVIWKGALLVATGEMKSAGALISFVVYAAFIGGSITELAETYTHMQKSLGATRHLFEILEEEPEPLTDTAGVVPQQVLDGMILFNNVSFCYPTRPDQQVLSGASFSVDANQKIALVGHSGAGKSTIAALLLRLYDPLNGNIYFGGRNIRNMSYSELRSQIALVPQDVFLFAASIRDNIAYGNPAATDDEIIAAARRANAWDFIQYFHQGIDTMVGDRGVQLSGGQRQRIAIARALLKNPRILILDEATSALDSESELLVQSALDHLMQGRTSIIIAHRLSTVREADKIIVIDKGKVAEEGTHHQLLGIEGGIYRSLIALQTVKEEVV
ncbi:ABC transporter ATP-binding protein [Chitinophaga tropicalis]|uniref:ATP-binding cassette domain-containing protein n=1 Tax=Chitinophaga tropicalis TaxID=2683588 RepID=A0A7K1UA68_9BACT|nr:ABC transporter transmembrane domain-containing protein [Chitinophaga tropicalis]MVT11262.1 ATP-binding cassette domain-containing protein [Chitinophaga tropicalis]